MSITLAKPRNAGAGKLINADYVRILYQSSHVLAVSKPPFTICQNEPGNPSSIFRLLQEKLPGCFSSELQHPFHAPKSVHRLDGLVSGVLLLGTSVPGTRQLAKQFRKRQISKTYIAIMSRLSGQPSLLDDRENGFIESEGCSTAWHLYKRLNVGALPAYIVRMHPREGKNHQLRRHAAHALNAPILFDRRYPTGPSGQEPLSMTCPHVDIVRQAVDDGIALHCASMTFRFGLEQVRVSCEPPNTGVWQYFARTYGINWTDVAQIDKSS
jgi:23S rRNA-/tRNA-specific pseudouridylate synthase